MWLSCFTLSDAKDIATILGVIIALIALVKGVYEYIKQGAQKRAEQFLELRTRFKSNETFKKIAGLIEKNNEALNEIPLEEKYEYLGFFEEIALVVNSKLMSPQIAHYMFGYYAMKCWKSNLFWRDINRESIYWIVFKKFVEKMETIETSFNYQESKLKF